MYRLTGGGELAEEVLSKRLPEEDPQHPVLLRHIETTIVVESQVAEGLIELLRSKLDAAARVRPTTEPDEEEEHAGTSAGPGRDLDDADPAVSSDHR